MFKRLFKINMIFRCISLAVFLLILNSSQTISRESPNLLESDKSSIYFELFGLSDKEKEYIKDNKIFYYASESNYAPLEYINDEGHVKGFGIQYLEFASKYLGIEFIPYPGMEELEWSERLELLKTGDLDILTSLSITKERLGYIHFTQPFLNANVIVIGNDDRRLILREEDMEGNVVALPLGYWHNEHIRSKVSDIKIINTQTMLDAFELINKYKADYTFLESTVYNYYSQKPRFQNLKIVGELNIKSSYSIGVTKDKVILRDIMNKVIQNAPKDLFYNNAMYVEKENSKWYVILSLFWIGISIFIILYLSEKLHLNSNYQKNLEKNKLNLIENLSHDLKTPLTSLKVNVSLLKHGIISKEEIQQQYKKLDKEIDMVNSIIDELYEITHIEDYLAKGGVNNNKTEHLASDLIKSFYEEKLAYVTSAKRNLIYQEHEVISSFINVDAKDIYRIFLNLLTNAIKYSREGDDIVLECRRQKDKVTYVFTDYGEGIRTDDLPHIFDRFYQVDHKSISKGRGLGLYIAKELAHLNNGSIKVKSQYGDYTIFYVSFPLVK